MCLFVLANHNQKSSLFFSDSKNISWKHTDGVISGCGKSEYASQSARSLIG